MAGQKHAPCSGLRTDVGAVVDRQNLYGTSPRAFGLER
jgi:hypothetical protein